MEDLFQGDMCAKKQRNTTTRGFGVRKIFNKETSFVKRDIGELENDMRSRKNKSSFNNKENISGGISFGGNFFYLQRIEWNI